MKIYRGSQKGNDWYKTDEKSSDECLEYWNYNRPILFDGTIDKEGSRHTSIGVELSDTDVLTLFEGLLKKYQKKISVLESTVNEQAEKIEEKENEIEYLRDSFRKIDYLITFNSDQAPSQKSLIEAIQNLSEHYSFYSNESEEHPKIDWVDWASL